MRCMTIFKTDNSQTMRQWYIFRMKRALTPLYFTQFGGDLPTLLNTISDRLKKEIDYDYKIHKK